MRRWFVTPVVLLPLAACNSPSDRLNAPPHGATNETRDSQGTFVYMQDNALLANMSVSDMHFLPHRALFSSTGLERVSRLASLMQAYGGTVRFSTDCTDDALTGQRTEAIRKFLSEAGVSTTVAQDLPGGSGMNASEAILIKAEEGTYKPRSSAGKGKTSAKSSTSGDSSSGDTK